MSSVLFSIGEHSIEFWRNRFKTFQIDYRGPFKRFNEEYLTLEDFDGMPIEPGSVLFEVATSGPGFTADESVENLGSSLRFPHWLENQREEIASMLEPLD